MELQSAPISWPCKTRPLVRRDHPCGARQPAQPRSTITSGCFELKGMVPLAMGTLAFVGASSSSSSRSRREQPTACCCAGGVPGTVEESPSSPARSAPPKYNSDPLCQPFKFGRWQLPGRLLLAPLESVSNCAYRHLCANFGAAFTWTEMLPAAALARANASTMKLVDTHDSVVPTGVQLIASSPRQLQRALQTLEERSSTTHTHWATGIHGVDLNFGCPAENVIKNAQGPVVLRDPSRLQKFFDVLAEWRAKTSLPIGVIGAKIRLGVNAKDEERGLFRKAVKAAVGRLDYVTVHARHAEDPSSSPARWPRIREAVDIAQERLKVLGNGDVFTRADARAMLAETGCDAVVIARGAIRTGGRIFDPSFAGDINDLSDEARRLRKMYIDLEKRFGSSSSKYSKYHRESFRRMHNRTIPSYLGRAQPEGHVAVEEQKQDQELNHQQERDQQRQGRFEQWWKHMEEDA